MLSTISTSRKNKFLLSTKWVKLTPKISHFLALAPGLLTEIVQFQVPFSVLIFGSIQIKNNQIERPSAAWLLPKLHVIRQLKSD